MSGPRTFSQTAWDAWQFHAVFVAVRGSGAIRDGTGGTGQGRWGETEMDKERERENWGVWKEGGHGGSRVAQWVGKEGSRDVRRVT